MASDDKQRRTPARRQAAPESQQFTVPSIVSDDKPGYHSFGLTGDNEHNMRRDAALPTICGDM
jgi:hypothetical protein